MQDAGEAGNLIESVGAATNAPCPEGMEERVVPAATYAVFDCAGPMPDAMQRLQHRILAEWVPSSGYGVGIEVRRGGLLRLEHDSRRLQEPGLASDREALSVNRTQNETTV